MRESVCVFCSSSDAVDSVFFEAAAELGASMARRDMTLIYGGGAIGLMGALARAVHDHGGRVVGVLPEFMHARGLAYQDADELVVTGGMRERKAVMEARADAFVCLPGGFGTLEEILEVLTFKQLELHTKPIVLLNTQGFYDHLLQMFDRLYGERFARPSHRRLLHVAEDAEGALEHIESYRPDTVESKWV